MVFFSFSILDFREDMSYFKIWIDFKLLALIGDQFCDEGPYVNGVWVNVRGKVDKISLWTKAAKNADVQMKIG